MNKTYFSWADIDKAADYIAYQIRLGKTRIDAIYGIPRGGLILGVILSHKLDVPLILDPLKAKNKKLLIVDDISDTGRTLEKLLHDVDFKFTPITATIHYSPKSRFKPDIYYETTWSWIVYPFETSETSKANYKK